MGDGRCRITLLGQVAIGSGDTEPSSSSLHGRRAELVFAYLVAEQGRLVTQDELADALWPERLPHTWEAALRGVLTDVRRSMSESGLDAGEILTTVRHGYRMELPDGVTVDLEEARQSLAGARSQLAEGAPAAAADSAALASSLARLRFLPNHEGEWVDGIRRELASINAGALEIEVRAHAAGGDLAAATAAADRLVRAEPFNEIAHQLRIRTLGQAGDRAGAAVAYEHCRRVLADELGVDPSDETREAYRAATAVSPVGGSPPPSTGAVTPPGLAALSVLVVEDHDFQRRTAMMLLRNLGIGTVSEAADGVSALALLEAASPPDVIVCDIDMPRMDGVEFIALVAELELAGAVIIASALDAKVIEAVRTVSEGYGLQVLGAIEKPLAARRLEELLATYRPRARQRTRPNDAVGSVVVTAAEARRALSEGRIRIHLRPGVDVATGRVTTADAVPSWIDPGRGWVSPDAFVPVLARERLLPELWGHALQTACANIDRFASVGLDLTISVAVAPESIQLIDWAVEAGAAARTAGVDPAQITFALDERALRASPGAALGMLTRLRVKGFGVGLANFGIGNAAIEQLSAVPLTEIVLAPVLVDGVRGDSQRLRALDETVQLGRRLGVAVVGAGCDSEDDLRALLEVGCDRLTGRFISDAMPADELPDWVASWDPDRLGVSGPG